MTKDHVCTIRLLSKSYEIKCPKDEQENVELAAKKLNKYIVNKKNEFKKLSDFQALLLAALHTSHELVICQTKQKEQRQDIIELISTLKNKLNSLK